MKNVYIWLGGLIGAGIVILMAYLLGRTQGSASERIKCTQEKVEAVKTIEAKLERVKAVVGSASDVDVERMLCDKYARGGCQWPDNIS